MIELLVVIGIIAILVALLVIVGGRVAGTGKQSATLSTVKVLDAALGAVIQDRGRLPRAVARDPTKTAPEEYWPIADGALSNTPYPELINSGGWFLQLASEIPGASDLSGIDPELIRTYRPPPPGPPPSTQIPKQPQITTPMDGWGNPIRFVHSDFDGNMRDVDPEGIFGPAPGSSYGSTYVSGVTVTRIGAVASEAEQVDLNADGGFAPGNQAYFYSAGPDGKVGAQVNSEGEVVEDFNEDNVYSAVPEFDREPPTS